MKNLVLTLMLYIVFSQTIYAQEKMVFKETFESNKLQWDETYDKSSYAVVQDGFLVLKNDDNETRSVADFPIDIEKNFKISFKIIAEKINDENWFGIIYNYEDENNYSCFFVQEKKFKVINKRNGESSISRKSDIILKSGKNIEVNIVVEKKGQKLIFTVDNMEVVSLTKPLQFGTFGFCSTKDKNTIKVDEVIIEQMSED